MHHRVRKSPPRLTPPRQQVFPSIEIPRIPVERTCNCLTARQSQYLYHPCPTTMPPYQRRVLQAHRRHRWPEHVAMEIGDLTLTPSAAIRVYYLFVNSPPMYMSGLTHKTNLEFRSQVSSSNLRAPQYHGIIDQARRLQFALWKAIHML